MPPLEWHQRVFRLRGLPNRISHPTDASQLLSEALEISAKHIRICSLAKTSNKWESPPSKVSTLHLEVVPECLKETCSSDQWEFPSPDGSDQMILDTHFQGLTVLNDVEPEDHHTDCIAISGLASHPFGSWQPRGYNKSFMWIRDELPKSIPGLRTIIYGYSSELLGSKSFQTISDIALALIHQLKTGGWNLPSAKPLIFLAHSLGGLVLKDAIIQIADREIIAGILDRFRGAIMFGVPSLGMHQDHLMIMTRGQANETLSEDLSRENGSPYLRRLNNSFEGLSVLQGAHIYWAYETKETRTAVLENDEWVRHGPLAVLVTPDSATCHYNAMAKYMTIPIDEDHSNMVKFSPGHKDLANIILAISDLCSRESTQLTSIPIDKTAKREDQPDFIKDGYVENLNLSPDDLRSLKELVDLLTHTEDFYQELYSRELDFRAEEIEHPYQDTFRWIFDQPLFCNWLQEGSGLFWVSGKPGSGKSTLMKYIMKSKYTWELLHDWRRSSSEVIEVVAGFFFHYRGTPLQKSFEGLLRSLILQVISSQYDSFQNRWSRLGVLQKEATSLAFKRTALRDELQKVQRDGMRRENETESYRIQVEKLHEALNQNEDEMGRIGTMFSNIAEEFRRLHKTPETEYLSQVVLVFRTCGGGFLSRLEKTLRQVLDQDIIKMDLILFFDALDEFDGHLDMMSKFLRDLLQNTGSTRVKVCFSSRPWESLQAHFSHEPGFSLQNYTKHDIEKYAAGELISLRARDPSIVKIVPEITSRARGVFLWVRLAVTELLDAVSGNDMIVSLYQVEERLQQLPDDLHEFYRRIVERINQPIRRHTYALLELIARVRDQGITVQTAWRAVSSADCSTYEDALDLLEHGNVYLGASATTMEGEINLWGGGLVEINRNLVQTMHQTVLEFVMGLSFRKDVLGDLESIITENGHSFHLKHLCSNPLLNDVFVDNEERKDLQNHAEQSELTTGNSQLKFISSIPWDTLNNLCGSSYSLPQDFNITLWKDAALLAFIVSNGLLLCLQDWIANNPGRLPRFNRPGRLGSHKAVLPLLSILFFSRNCGTFHERCTNMAYLLLESGFSIQQDPDIFPSILQRIWQSERGDEPIEDTRIPAFTLHRLAVIILRYMQDPNVSVCLPSMWTEPLAIYNVRPLHVAPPVLAAALIEHGADPNLTDDHGRTPLDWVLRFPDKVARENRVYNIQWRYSLCKLLVGAGGLFASCSENDWISTLEEFEMKGFDTMHLRESSLPEKNTGQVIPAEQGSIKDIWKKGVRKIRLYSKTS